MSEGSLCINLLKKILLMAGIRPVTMSLVCKRWKRVIDELSMHEKWSHQLDLARAANVPLSGFFSLDPFVDIDVYERDVMYFVQTLRQLPSAYAYGTGKCSVYMAESGQIATITSYYTVYWKWHQFDYVHVSPEGLPYVSNLKCFNGQYTWSGNAIIHRTRKFIYGVCPHGMGTAEINGKVYVNICADYGALRRPTRVPVYPDMTANLFGHI